jgi:hypothetical protein
MISDRPPCGGTNAETDSYNGDPSESSCSRRYDSILKNVYLSSIHRLLVISLLMISSVRVLGQSDKKPPEYKSERAQEDYRYLFKASLYEGPHDFFDPIKFIPLSGSGKVYLSVGGEIRPQYERFTNPGWGEEQSDPSGYLLQRFMLHTDLHFGPHVWVFGQLKSGLIAGKRGTPNLPDEDRLDLHQAFLDLTSGEDSALTLRLGRQEMSYGSSRLISLREGPNVRQSFDGIRLMTKARRLKLDGFVTQPSTTEPGVFDDRPDPDVSFWGVYGVRSFPRINGGLDLYYLGFANNRGHFAQGIARERRHSVGTRWWGDPGAFIIMLKLCGSCRFGPWRIQAGTVSAELGHTWKKSRLSPNLMLRTEYISGDKDSASSNLQTFNPLFPKGAYFGQVAQIGPANLVGLHPFCRCTPPVTPL